MNRLPHPSPEDYSPHSELVGNVRGVVMQLAHEARAEADGTMCYTWPTSAAASKVTCYVPEFDRETFVIEFEQPTRRLRQACSTATLTLPGKRFDDLIVAINAPDSEDGQVEYTITGTAADHQATADSPEAITYERASRLLEAGGFYERASRSQRFGRAAVRMWELYGSAMAQYYPWR